MPTNPSAMLRSVLAAVGVWLATPAAAQTAADRDSTLAPAPLQAGGVAPGERPAVPADPVELARMLGDASWAARDRAEQALLSHPVPCVSRIEKVLTGPISVEHRQRLLNVCKRRFFMEPRAALGVRFAQGADERGVVIDMALTNFDAARVIESGDAILSMDGMAIREADDLRGAIVSHDPGDVVSIRLLRAGEPIIGAVRLGAFADLQERWGLNPEIVSGAWAWRLARLGVDAAEPEPIESALTPAAWQAAAREASTAPGNAAMARRGASDEGVGVTVGGEARPSLGTVSGAASQGTPRIVIFNGDRADPQASRVAQLALAERRLADLRTQIASLSGLVEPMERALSRGNLGERERARIIDEVLRYRRSVEILRLEEQRLVQQIAVLKR